MERMKLTDNQMALEYAMYMIASSYFKHATCRNRLLEQRMLIQYKEQKLDNQYRFEETCIAYMENLVKKLPGKILTDDTEVHFVPGRHEVHFESDKHILVFRCLSKGRKISIRGFLIRKIPA